MGGIDLQALAKNLVPLQGISDDYLYELLADCVVEPLFADQVIFEVGSFKREHIYLLHGDVEITDSSGATQILKGRASLYPICPELPRHHTARALTDGSVLRIDSERLDKLLTWSQVCDYQQLDISYQPELDEDSEWMLAVIRSNLFYKVPPTNAEYIFSRLKPVLLDSGEVVLRQGEIGDGCYFIKEGEARVTRNSGGGERWLADIGVGRCFGEDALLNEVERNATVTMLTDGVLMRLEKADFIALLAEPDVDKAPLAALADDSATVIDVRTAAEFQCGRLEGAVNIPLSLLRLQSRQLAVGTKYVICCDTGSRSRAATSLLQRLGFDVAVVEGGLRGLDTALVQTHSNYRLRMGAAELCD